jgi:hypothetical protein
MRKMATSVIMSRAVMACHLAACDDGVSDCIFRPPEGSSYNVRALLKSVRPVMTRFAGRCDQRNGYDSPYR